MLFRAYSHTSITSKPFTTTQVVHAVMLLFSERVRDGSREELAGLNAVVSDDADHLVELGTHLDAAGETTVRGVGCVVAQEPRLLERKRLVAFLVPRVRDHHAALRAGYSC